MLTSIPTCTRTTTTPTEVDKIHFTRTNTRDTPTDTPYTSPKSGHGRVKRVHLRFGLEDGHKQYDEGSY